MYSNDEVVKPICRTLFRQSSVETRLTPARVSDDSDSDYEDIPVPKVVGLKPKTITPPRRPSQENVANKKFAEELQKKLILHKPNEFVEPRNTLQKEFREEPSDEVKVIKPVHSPMYATVNKNLLSELQGKLSKPEDKVKKPKPAVPPRKSSNTPQTENINQNFQKFKDSKSTSRPDSAYENVYHDVKSKSRPNSGYENVTSENETPIKTIFSRHNSIENNVLYAELSLYSKELNSEDNLKKECEKNEVGTIKALSLKKKETDEVGGASKDEEMATSRPKSPRPNVPKVEKDESIWDKLGTLGRKKKIKEVLEVQAEGKYAIDSPGLPAFAGISPEDYNLDENEERMIIDPKSYEDRRFIDLINVLIEWVNDELASQRIIVQNLAEDLYDGQVLQKLLEKLTGDKLDVPEVTQSEEGQKQKLAVVLAHFNKVLGIQRLGHNKWNVEAIHSKNIVAIIHLLVSLARHFRPPVRLTENVSINVTVVQKKNNQLMHRVVKEVLTSSYDDVGMKCERDAFDTLIDHAPDKLQVVKKSLVTFVNKHLNKMNFEVTEIESQFHDGVYLIMLMGLLEGFFVPHYSFNLTPHEFEQKVHNVGFAFELMEEVGLKRPKARPEDIVNQDLKSTLRVLYNLFLKYKVV